MKRIVGAYLALAIIAGACAANDTDPSSSEEPSASTEPQSAAVVAEGVETVVAASGVEVTIPPDGAPAGSTLSITVVADHPARDEMLGQVVDIDLDAELLSPATISMPFDAARLATDDQPWAYTWMDESESWLAQETTAYEEHIAVETMHFSTWTWGHPRHLLGRITGDRTTPPECGDDLPTWARDLTVVDDPNTTVFACAEADGDLLRVTLKANRGVPVLVEFSHEPTVVDGSLQSTLLTKLLQGRWPSRVFIEARKELTVSFPRPGRAGVISAKRWGGSSERFLITGLVVVFENLFSGAPGKINDLYGAAKCVLDAYGLIESDTELDGVGGALDVLASCLGPRLDGFLADGLIDVKVFHRLNKAFAMWLVTGVFTRLMDDAIVDSEDHHDFFGVRALPPEPVTINGLQVDGLTSEGPLPLRWGDDIDTIVDLTGGVVENLCGMDTPDYGVSIDLDGITLFADHDGLFQYYVGEDRFSTPSGLRVGLPTSEIERLVPELVPHPVVEGYWADGEEISFLVAGGDNVFSISGSASAGLQPEAGVC